MGIATKTENIGTAERDKMNEAEEKPEELLVFFRKPLPPVRVPVSITKKGGGGGRGRRGQLEGREEEQRAEDARNGEGLAQEARRGIKKEKKEEEEEEEEEKEERIQAFNFELGWRTVEEREGARRVCVKVVGDRCRRGARAGCSLAAGKVCRRSWMRRIFGE